MTMRWTGALVVLALMTGCGSEQPLSAVIEGDRLAEMADCKPARALFGRHSAAVDLTRSEWRHLQRTCT